ncbi:MAG: hypothetical protein IT343_13070 [Candidatus Melainabacteria bacterium]|nr:hypothetical protein [Candidatus Melainabacteria bacterium]
MAEGGMLDSFAQAVLLGVRDMEANVGRKKTIKRGLSKFIVGQCALAMTIGTAIPSFATSFVEYSPFLPQQAVLREPEIQKLGTYDLALVIDKSASMTYRLNQRNAPQKSAEIEDGLDRPLPVAADPGDSITRWDWCKNQARNLAEQIKKVLPSGLKLSMFSNNYDSYANVDGEKVEALFNEVEPSGGTHVSRVLSHHLDEYFAHRDAGGDKIKPLLLAMITDGAPEDGMKTKEAIIRATKNMKRSDEILIAILQVGNDRRAPKFLADLDEGLVNQNAKYDIVEVKSFAEIKKQGLARVLANLVTRDHVASLPQHHI